MTEILHFEICENTDKHTHKQTNKQTDMGITIPPMGGEVNMFIGRRPRVIIDIY